MKNSPNHQIYHKETLTGKDKEQNRLWMWILFGSNHYVRYQRCDGNKSNLCLAPLTLLAFNWKFELVHGGGGG